MAKPVSLLGDELNVIGDARRRSNKLFRRATQATKHVIVVRMMQVHLPHQRMDLCDILATSKTDLSTRCDETRDVGTRRDGVKANDASGQNILSQLVMQVALGYMQGNVCSFATLNVSNDP